MRNDGFTLVELLVVLAILAALMALTVPAFQSGASEIAMRGAAQSAASTFVRARLLAIQSSRETAVRIESDATGYRLLIYQDGNGNGVRNAEIASGRDRVVPAGAVWSRNDIRIGIFKNTRVPDPSNPKQALDRLDDPVRFNNSNLWRAVMDARRELTGKDDWLTMDLPATCQRIQMNCGVTTESLTL